MPHLDPTWQSAAACAVAVLLLAALARWRRWRLAPALGEATLVVSLYAVWQWLGATTHHAVAGATGRALDLWHLERALHLPSEVSVQALVLPHDRLVQLCNGYYLYGHFNPVIALLAWLFWRHRDAYPRVRLVLCALTALAFAIHFVPVAPPRLLPELGFRDVALEQGQSVYGPFTSGLAGQLLAMPSLHVGWSLLVAWAVVTVSRSRWRWLVLAHPVLMSLVVVATANHWWLDGIAAGALLVGCVLASRFLPRRDGYAVARDHRPGDRRRPVPVPLPG